MAISVLEKGAAADAPPLPKAISADSHIIEPLEAYARHMKHLGEEVRRSILHDNVKVLYGLVLD